MAGQSIESREVRTSRYLSAPQTLIDICAHVANGGSLTQLAASQDVRYSDIIGWIIIEPLRSKAYNLACQARNEWAIERLLDELRAIGLVDIREAFTEDGRLKPISEIPLHITKCIAGIEVVEEWGYDEDDEKAKKKQIGWNKKIKVYDKLRAIELLGKNLKMFMETIEHKGNINVTITSKIPRPPRADQAHDGNNDVHSNGAAGAIPLIPSP